MSDWQEGYASGASDAVRMVQEFLSLNPKIMGKTEKENLLDELKSLAPAPRYVPTSLFKDEREWWHKRWHRDLGIPCDGTMEVCKRANP